MKISILVLVGLFMFTAVALAEDQAQTTINKEMIIKVKPNLIALPAGEAANVPVNTVRIRSTELRELNKQYNAVSMEKLYSLKGKAQPKSEEDAAQTEKILKSSSIDAAKKKIDLTNVLTKKTEKALKEKGNETEELPDIYLIQFQLKPGIDMGALVTAYKKADVVLDADEIIRRDSNENQ